MGNELVNISHQGKRLPAPMVYRRGVWAVASMLKSEEPLEYSESSCSLVHLPTGAWLNVGCYKSDHLINLCRAFGDVDSEFCISAPFGSRPDSLTPELQAAAYEWRCKNHPPSVGPIVVVIDLAADDSGVDKLMS